MISLIPAPTFSISSVILFVLSEENLSCWMVKSSGGASLKCLGGMAPRWPVAVLPVHESIGQIPKFFSKGLNEEFRG